MSTNVTEPKRWHGVEVWTYDSTREDDCKDIRNLDELNHIYVGMEYDTHAECSYLYNRESTKVPVVVMEYMSRDCLVSHFQCLEKANLNRILVFIPNDTDLLNWLDELNVPYQSAAD
ncbi:hypothetical protein [Vibrio phage pTD1]|uniref:Uncharacterized protein n=1 Tax=Vibrio phage pTD1 TaxID=1938577 RepID=A0A1Q2U2M7_9CAUD|nr:hypothetical protein FDH33_gp001 [Vibrio phage pTD1]BAW98210.1 hypothetical protein [Vibrio phage pTD1]